MDVQLSVPQNPPALQQLWVQMCPGIDGQHLIRSWKAACRCLDKAKVPARNSHHKRMRDEMERRPSGNGRRCRAERRAMIMSAHALLALEPPPTAHQPKCNCAQARFGARPKLMRRCPSVSLVFWVQRSTGHHAVANKEGTFLSPCKETSFVSVRSSLQ